MSGLYPLKFFPIYHEKIWGGNKMKSLLGKDFSQLSNCGESWELSSVEDNISVVSNGFLAGNNLNELIEIYMGDLTGDKVYEKFGNEFPLLFKFIDANDDLSVQVHPDDEMSKERHNAWGKTEMWYVIDAEKDALINSGFNRELTKNEYLEYLESNRLSEILHYDKANAGDVFFIPAGRVHAIGKGVVLAEIQETSDVTYRIFDYNRRDANGNLRELHNDLALDAIDFTWKENYKTQYSAEMNKPAELVSCDYFTTNLVQFSETLTKDFNLIDSFVAYMNIDGRYSIKYEGGEVIVEKGETVLIPASLESFILEPLSPEVKTLEVYIR